MPFTTSLHYQNWCSDYFTIDQIINSSTQGVQTTMEAGSDTDKWYNDNAVNYKAVDSKKFYCKMASGSIVRSIYNHALGFLFFDQHDWGENGLRIYFVCGGAATMIYRYQVGIFLESSHYFGHIGINPTIKKFGYEYRTVADSYHADLIDPTLFGSTTNKTGQVIDYVQTYDTNVLALFQVQLDLLTRSDGAKVQWDCRFTINDKYVGGVLIPYIGTSPYSAPAFIKPYFSCSSNSSYQYFAMNSLMVMPQ